MTLPSAVSLVRVPATFPVDRRPIYVTPIAAMTNKNKDAAWPAMATAVVRLVAKHPDDRVLIHTVSYDLAKFLTRELVAKVGPRHNKVFTYRTAKERDTIIAKYRRTEGAILIAPSLERGVDFRDDDCRVVIVCKIPWPNLGDKQVSARLHSQGGQLWYSVAAVRSLVQMTGRGMRGPDDHCVTFILDAAFVDNIWKKSRGLLPEWWTAALDMTAKHVRELTRP